MFRDALTSIRERKGTTEGWFRRLACGPFRRLEYTKAILERGRNSFRFAAPIAPFRLISVSPKDITVMLEQPFDRSDFIAHSPVIDGGWDTAIKPLQEYDLFRSVYSHFRHDIPWEETDLYRRVKADIEENENWSKWGCKDLADFENRCRRIDALYDHIATEGYQTQRELKHSDADPVGVRRCRPPEWHEVTVHVGRDGRFIFHEGRHRLAIAHALKLDSIPARVMVRHRTWQSRRDEAYLQGDESDVIDIRTHPDVRAFLDTYRTLGDR